MIGTHKTKIYTNDNQITVKYHNTDVFKYNIKDNQIQLNSGGWYTNTTKKRINQAFNQFGINAILFQNNFDWFVIVNNQTLNFTDNMIINL